MAINIPSIFEQRNQLLSADYKSAGSNQTETYKYLNHADNTDYETIYTVQTGKTFYVTSIIFAVTTATIQLLATGGSGSETNFLALNMVNTSNEIINFSIPLKFSAGTRISWSTLVADTNNHVTLTGWEE